MPDALLQAAKLAADGSRAGIRPAARAGCRNLDLRRGTESGTHPAAASVSIAPDRATASTG
jgi:hypothetical protein